MRTPAGKECRYYHEDFHRGRNIQECRLVNENPESQRWHPSDCNKCPVPDILLANASPDLALTLIIKKGFLGFGRSHSVTARCLKHHVPVEDPYIGCTLDHGNAALDLFRQALEGDDD